MQLKNLVFVDGRNGLYSCFRDRIGGILDSQCYSMLQPQLHSLGSCRQYMSVLLLEDDVCLTGGRFENLMMGNHDKARCLSMFFVFFHVILKWAFQRKSLLRNVRMTSNIRAMLRPRSVQLACSSQVFAPGRHNLSKASKSRKADFSDSFLLSLLCSALIGMNWSSLEIYLSSMCWGVAISLPLRCCRQWPQDFAGCVQTRREWLILELCMTRNSRYNLEIAYDLSPDIRYPLPLRSRPRCRQKLARLALCLAESWSFGRVTEDK